MVYKPTENIVRIFKNGNLVASQVISGQFQPGTGNLIVGRFGNWIIDEMRVWSRALSGAEIKRVMNTALTGKEPGLRAYYTFDGTTRDITGQGNDGLFMYKERYVSGKR